MYFSIALAYERRYGSENGKMTIIWREFCQDFIDSGEGIGPYKDTANRLRY
jgi:hypothetical protein